MIWEVFGVNRKLIEIFLCVHLYLFTFGWSNPQITFKIINLNIKALTYILYLLNKFI